MVDTPRISGTPEVVLTCEECRQMKPIGGTRFVHPDVPEEVLCEEDFALADRFGTPEERFRLHPLGPASDTDPDGTVWLRRTCPRCNGAGQVGGYRGTCFQCWGTRWTYISPRGVQRVMRWSATFQGNRIPRSQL